MIIMLEVGFYTDTCRIIPEKENFLFFLVKDLGREINREI